jgi:CRP/FNR family cyclic AMP-dependent transcriptional regulator
MLRRFLGTPRVAELDERTRQWKLSLLSKAEVFRDLPHDEMEEIERVTTMTTCRKGRVFYTPGDQSEVLFILKKGRVQISRLAEDGRKFTIAILEPGSIFGEMPLLSQTMQDSTAEALDDCTICIMSRHDLESMVRTNPQVALNIVHNLASRVHDLESRLEMQAFQSVPERLAATLLRLAGDGSEISGASHQQIGETIGASRETVTRTLGDFRSRGLIKLGRGHIVINDREGLDEVSHQEPGG